MFEDRSSQSESQERLESHDASSMTLKIVLVAFVLVAGFVAGYAWLQHNAVQQLAAERSDLRASLNQAKNQVDDLRIRVNTLAAAKEREEAMRAQAEAEKTSQTSSIEPAPTHAGAAPRHRKHHAANRATAPDDPRWQKVQQQLGDQQKQLVDSQKQIADT